MTKTPAILSLDIEDPITIRSHHAAEWICQQISDAGLTASCFLVAEKVRAWERLGLSSVIEAVGAHDLGFHSSRHSLHPAISEISEALPAQVGAEQLWGWEQPGWEATKRIMGAAVNHWGLTGGSWSPALSVMLGQHGQALMYSPIYGDDPYRPCWFACSLNFPDYVAQLDHVYYDDKMFASALSEYQQRVEERLTAQAPYLGLFCCHPTRVVHHSWWDEINFGQGRITVPEQWQAPPEMSPTEEDVARQNLRRYLEWVVSDERFEVIGFSQLVRMFSRQASECPRWKMLEICQRISDEQAVVFTDEFSAAEILGMMVECALSPDRQMLTRRSLLAPQHLPTEQSASNMTTHEIILVAATVDAHLRAARSLPDRVDCPSGSLYIADYFVALAQALLARENQTGTALQVTIEVPYPAIGDSLAQQTIEHIRNWIVHRLDLDLSWIQRETRLLSWTFKPAWTSEELSRLRVD